MVNPVVVRLMFVTVRPIITIDKYTGPLPAIDDYVEINEIRYRVTSRVWDYGSGTKAEVAIYIRRVV